LPMGCLRTPEGPVSFACRHRRIALVVGTTAAQSASSADKGDTVKWRTFTADAPISGLSKS
ncbi:MAG: hypothetical protein AAFN16_05980, partial [Pseudomonadota bacterium]